MVDAGRGAFEDASPLVDELFERLASEPDALAHGLVETYQREIPDYAAVPAAALLEGARIESAAAIAGVRSGKAPSPADLEIAAHVGAERAGAGISLEAVLQAFRVGGREILGRVRAIGEELGVDADMLLEIFDHAWSWVNQVSIAAAEGHRRAEVLSIRADAQDRAALLHGFLHGTLPIARLRAHAATLGIGADQQVFALRARAREDIPAHRLEALVAERGEANAALVGLLDGDIAAVVLRRPELPESLVAGIGAPVSLEALEASFADATRALEAAVAFRRDGVFSVEDLALEIAFSDERIGNALEHRCMGAVDALGERGEALEETLREFLSSGMRYEQTARAQVLHPNTLRKRLARYEELTGLDLRRMDDLVALWWALEHRRLRGAGSNGDLRP